MAVDDAGDARVAAVDLAVDEALDVAAGRAVAALDRLRGGDVVFDDVGGAGDEGGGEVAREVEGRGVRGVARGDVAVGVEHGMVGEDVVGGDECAEEVG